MVSTWTKWLGFALALFLAAAASPAGTAEGIAALEKGNYRKARDEFATAAKQGEAEAQFQLAELYRRGRGVARSPRLALEWYEKAVTQGHMDAAGRMGAMLWHGNGVTARRADALAMLRKGVEGASAIAQYELALLHFKGEKVGLTGEQCYKLFREAGEAGHAQAQTRYGVGLLHGSVNGAEDPVSAERWFRLAAAQGDVEAMKNLGRLLAKRDEHEGAIVLYRKAALSGDAGAQWALGGLCLVAKKRPEAYAWYRIASKSENSRKSATPAAVRHAKNVRAEIRKRIKGLEGRLTPEELREGKALAKQYRKTIRDNLRNRAD